MTEEAKQMPELPNGLLNPDMASDEMRLHMGELKPAEVLVARAAIRWANTRTPPITVEMVEGLRRKEKLSYGYDDYGCGQDNGYNAALDAVIAKMRGE